MIFRIIFLLALILNFPGISFSAKRTSDAILCSSIYYIVTSMTEGDEAGQEMLMKNKRSLILFMFQNKRNVMANKQLSISILCI